MPQLGRSTSVRLAVEESYSAQLERRREQCRENQARYRERQHERMLKTQADTVTLRLQVATLEKLRQNALQAVRVQTVWGLAAEFLGLFKHGISNPNGHHGVENSNAQLDFLRATVTPDVTDGSVYGIDALLERWRLYSLVHNDLDIELVRLEMGAPNTVVATTRVSMTITESTLYHAFRHLLNGNASHSERLVAKLLGQRLTMRGSVRFGRDDTRGRVRSITHSADMLTPMLKLLGNLEDVAFVFSRARLTPDDSVLL